MPNAGFFPRIAVQRGDIGAMENLRRAKEFDILREGN
jgi:hypothetical protein